MLHALFSISILITLSILVRNTFHNRRAKWAVNGFIVSAVGCGLYIGFIIWAAPPITFPKPSGQFSVALTHMVIDTKRSETYTLNPEDTRKLHLKVWYPTPDISDLDLSYYKPAPKQAAYSSPNMAAVHAKAISSVGPLSSLEKPMTHRLQQALLAASAGGAPLMTQEKFPILLFSPGHRAHLDYFSITMQDLASHGYIVVGVNHSYEPKVSILPTGEFYSRTDTALENAPARSANDYVGFQRRLEKNYAIINQYKTNEEYQQNQSDFFNAYNNIIDTPQSLTEDLPIRVADMLSTLSFLQSNIKNQNPSALFNIMDISNVGAFGMSFGGPTSAEFCRAYGECTAIANIDGQNWGNMLKQPLSTPMLWISGSYTDHKRFDVPYTLNHWNNDAYRVFVPGASHRAFTDAPFLSPIINLALIEFSAILKPGKHREHIHEITNGALVQLFNHYAKKQPLNLDSLESKLSGVRVEEYLKDANAGIE